MLAGRFKPQTEYATMSQSPASTSSQKINPHCAKQWPQRNFDPVTAGITTASLSAIALLQLLQSDEAIAADLADLADSEDDPLPQPFSPYFRSGLMQALGICLQEIQRYVEILQAQASAAEV
jgi:hypothetical protein